MGNGGGKFTELNKNELLNRLVRWDHHFHVSYRYKEYVSNIQASVQYIYLSETSTHEIQTNISHTLTTQGPWA